MWEQIGGRISVLGPEQYGHIDWLMYVFLLFFRGWGVFFCFIIIFGGFGGEALLRLFLECSIFLVNDFF